MNRWHPAPRALIDDELTRRWSRENPAPDLVIHMVLCSRIESGHPWGKRRLAEWAGLTDWKARKAIARAREWMADWHAKMSRTNRKPPGDPDRSQQLGDPNRPSRARVLHLHPPTTLQTRERERARDTMKLEGLTLLALSIKKQQPPTTQDNHHGQQGHSPHRALAHCEQLRETPALGQGHRGGLRASPRDEERWAGDGSSSHLDSEEEGTPQCCAVP